MIERLRAWWQRRLYHNRRSLIELINRRRFDPWNPR